MSAELEAVAAAALGRLKAARAAGDDLAAELAEHELNRALDSIAAERGPGSHRKPPGDRRPRSASSKTRAGK